MNVLLLEEHDDGSATYTFDLTIEERDTLLSLGIITALKNGIQEGSKYVSNTDLGYTQCGTPDSLHGEGEQPRESGQP
jgi:hypothetical protein